MSEMKSLKEHIEYEKRKLISRMCNARRAAKEARYLKHQWRAIGRAGALGDAVKILSELEKRL